MGESAFRGNSEETVSEDKLYFKNKLRDTAFSSLYNFNSFTAGKRLSDLPPEELSALKILSKNKDIVVMKPDKGTGVIILNTVDYIAKVEQIILDESKFQKHKNQDLYKISRSVETKVRNYLREHVKKPGYIDAETYSRLYPNGSHISVMYGLPKVHKANCPMRPICSAVGSSTYEISKYLAKILQPAAKNSNGTDLKDTFQFVQLINGVNISNHVMVTFDVQSLFTNVPLAETINICMDRLYRCDGIEPPELPEHVLKQLIELCVKDNVFVFNGKVYSQIDGVAMGNRLGPILANVFMAHLEETGMVNSEDFPSFYGRYVDDAFCLFESIEQANRFLEYINQLHPSIKFDMTAESDGKITFLDTSISHSDTHSTADLSTHIKEQDKGLFYHFSSFIPDRYKMNKISSLLYRAYHIASDMFIFHRDLEILKSRFLSNGFPRHMIEKCTEVFLNKHHAHEDTQNRPSNATRDRDVVISLPYLGPMSLVVRRKLLNLVKRFYPSVNLKIVFKRGLQVSNLFSFKDRFPLKCKSMIVYYINCRKCGPSEAYIGKTINTVHERFYASGTGHLHPNNSSSPFHEHVINSGDNECGFHFEDIKVLEQGQSDEEIKFIESILLKYDRQNLNTCERSIKLEIV